MRDEARQTHSGGRAQRPGVSAGRIGSRASGGDPSRWERWPTGGWALAGPAGQKRGVSLRERRVALLKSWQEPAEKDSRSVWGACRPTAVRVTESLGSKKRSFSSPVTRAGLSVEL